MQRWISALVVRGTMAAVWPSMLISNVVPGATKGIMITTSGYGPDSYKFASGKPLNLIDGSGLLSLCQQRDIPARIVNRGKRKNGP